MMKKFHHLKTFCGGYVRLSINDIENEISHFTQMIKI